MKKFLLLSTFSVFLIHHLSAQTIAAGAYCSYAICSDHTVKAWGWNNYGQLGDNTTTDRHTPVSVNGLGGVIKIASGGGHVLALKDDGTVWAWGMNDYGQLGEGSVTESHVPIQVPGLSDIVQVACGEVTSLAIRADGTVWAWGDNTYGGLGDSSYTERHSPVQVYGLQGIISVASGAFQSLALRMDGTVWAWGYNFGGQSGNADTANADHWTPVQVSISNVKAIDCGGYFCLAIKDDSTIWGWGQGGTYGELGDSVYMYYGDAYLPIPVTGISGVTGIGGGENHSLAVTADGSAWGWGYNSAGQLGIGSTALDTTYPVQMTGLTSIVAVSSEAWHSLMLKSDSTLWACGTNMNGELGDGSSDSNPHPITTQVTSLCPVLLPPASCTSDFLLVADTTQAHTYFILSNPTGTPPFHHMWSWGDDTYDTTAYPTHVYADTGSYTICHSVFDFTGCSSDYCTSSSLHVQLQQVVTVNVVPNIPTGIHENTYAPSFTVYPNPNSGTFKITTTQLINPHLEIFSMLGEKIYSSALKDGNIELTAKAGLYFVKVTDGEKVCTQKLVIQ